LSLGTQNFEAFRNDQTLGLSNKIRQIMFEDKAPYYYTSVHREQQDLMRDSYDLNVLRSAMKAFTSLQEVQLLAIMVHKDIVLRNLASSFDNWEFIDCKWIPACKHAVETMLRALYDANSPVTALCSPTMSPQSLVLLGPKARQISRRTWSQLTCLEITFDERPDRSYLDTSGTVLTGHSETMADMFQNLLHMAQNLSTLYIRFTPGMPVRLPLRDAFHHDVRWPKLRVLGIGSWMLRADELVDIVRRHGRTLTGFRLSEVYLLDDDRWRDVMAAVKEAAPGLEWVGLHDVSYEREYVRKQAYIETYSDTSSEYDDDQYGLDLDGLSMRSRDSASSTTASHDLSLPLHPAQGGDGDDGDGDDDDVLYGNVFTTASTSPTLGGGGTSSVYGGSVFEVGELEDGLGEDLEDDGRTVTQAQRRHWERWVVGRYASGEVYTRAL
jgi:hypothetical protein